MIKGSVALAVNPAAIEFDAITGRKYQSRHLAVGRQAWHTNQFTQPGKSQKNMYVDRYSRTVTMTS